MVAWKSLTSNEISERKQGLRDALKKRGIRAQTVDLEPAGLAGHYRLSVVSDNFDSLDYSDRLAVIEKALRDAWQRADQLRITLTFALSPSEVPASAKRRSASAKRPKPQPRRKVVRS
jgi:stress-induced morphogen